MIISDFWSGWQRRWRRRRRRRFFPFLYFVFLSLFFLCVRSLRRRIKDDFIIILSYIFFFASLSFVSFSVLYSTSLGALTCGAICVSWDGVRPRPLTRPPLIDDVVDLLGSCVFIPVLLRGMMAISRISVSGFCLFVCLVRFCFGCTIY